MVRHLKTSLGLAFAIVVLSVLAIVVLPRFASAEAGAGGGGSSSGCSQFNYSTCFGAVWRYYKTSSNFYQIRNVNGGFTNVTGCGATGGFFAYVLVHKNYPNDPNQVRSWQIGPADGEPGNRSMFFGGWTHYRVYSSPSDPLPTNPSSGDYSWYSVEKAFAQTKQLGQNSGFEWHGGSTLGWFCYRGLNYNLEPTITVSPNASEGGSQVAPVPNVNNTGSTSSSNVQWQVTTFRVNPGGTVPGGPATNGTTPVNHYGNNASVIASGTRGFNRGNNAIPVAQQTLGDFPVGTRICFALSIQPYRHDNGNWRHSIPACVTIVKKPKVQILGNDLIVGKETTRNVVSSTTSKSLGGANRTFGSWAEYGLIASGTVIGMASGGGYSGGATSNNFCAASLLTLANAGSSTCGPSTTKGGYTMNKLLPDIGARFTNATSRGNNPSLDIASLPTGVYSATGTITLSSSSTVPKGKWVVINAPQATVNITSDIVYTSEALQAISEIPQVVIIANNINIASGVTRADAWLVATGANGNLNTCAEAGLSPNSGSLNANRCQTPLTVNGPVIARHLYLWRTAGAGTGAESAQPAEVFNLRPDAYLWATAYTAGAGRLPTVSTTELPPRF